MATFGLVVAGLGTALALSNAAAAPPTTTVALPRLTQLPPATMPSSMPPTVLPSTPPSAAVNAAPVSIATPAVVEQTAHRQPSPATRPKPAPAPAPAPAQPQAQAAPPPEDVEVEHRPSVREELRTLREQIRSRVDKHLQRLKALTDG